MFKRKLYKIKYEWIGVDTIFIEATNQYQALKKFKKEMKRIMFIMPSIISFEEI